MLKHCLTEIKPPLKKVPQSQFPHHSSSFSPFQIYILFVYFFPLSLKKKTSSLKCGTVQEARRWRRPPGGFLTGDAVAHQECVTLYSHWHRLLTRPPHFKMMSQSLLIETQLTGHEEVWCFSFSLLAFLLQHYLEAHTSVLPSCVMYKDNICNIVKHSKQPHHFNYSILI